MVQNEDRANDVRKFAKEVYQQCVEKGWSLSDYRLFAHYIEMSKESAFREVRTLVERTPLPNDF